jgi:hypothetical protein
MARIRRKVAAREKWLAVADRTLRELVGCLAACREPNLEAAHRLLAAGLDRLFEELRNRGYGGGYDAVRCYAGRWSKEGTQQPRRTCR